jgi:predicted Zn-ribbon and HTH transcriptional regulator
MKKKICKTCGWKFDNDREIPILNKNIKDDVRLTKEFCKNHKYVYGDECEPIWCEECGHLDKYLVTISKNSKEPKFDKRK